MSALALSFGSPLLLFGLLALPIIWWLLRLTPPKPKQEVFPPTRILEEIAKREETPAHSPWWLTLLRLAMMALIILALADPIRNAQEKLLEADGPVLVVLNDTWASGPEWEARRSNAIRVVQEAGEDERPVSVVFVSQGAKGDWSTGTSAQAEAKLAAAEPKPVPASFAPLAEKLKNSTDNFGTVVWFSTGLQESGTSQFAEAISAKGIGETVFYDSARTPVVVTGVSNEPDALKVELERAGGNASGQVTAYDVQGRSLSSTAFEFAGTETEAQARFVLPVELRNEIARVSIDNAETAGAVQLLDERFRRRKVGLISGGKADAAAQPLLSPLYYISRALAPFSEIREANDANVIAAVPELISQRISTLVLADIGTLPEDAQKQIDDWVGKGGMLVRFAGPRLAGAEEDSLVPVELRRGGRSLGGTLTWGTPQPLASFEQNSPFSGIEVPQDVAVTRQVLAQPGIELADKTWASLADGTPLVTASKRGEGWIVLFHVTADANWSNLPLSGAFVDMLRRIVAVSNGAISLGEPTNSAVGSAAADASTTESTLPPLRSLDGFGNLGAPAPGTKPLISKPPEIAMASLENPPGLYGTSDAFVAINLFNGPANLKTFDAAVLPPNSVQRGYSAEQPYSFKPWLLGLALVLLTLDCLAVLWMAGAMRSRRLASTTAAALLMVVTAPLLVGESHAQSSLPDFENTFKTRLAYVITGDSALDSTSRKGLIGLTQFIASRTALEPGQPVGIDVATDELAFYPLLYWPISDSSKIPEAATMGRIDAFMKKGGSVLFDTRDQLSGGFGGTQVSAATQRLRLILSSLDIPPLEPVPNNHVLTRAFYLLDVFPGRYLNGQLWVETSERQEDDANRPARQGDGVSSILITSNDFAGAWAIEPSGAPSLPIVPPNVTQRTYAYRTGVNIVMYTLTGNYKSDQVHVPALLERLGQ